MSQGSVQRMAHGRTNPENIYILLKNNSVWKLKRPIKTQQEKRELVERLQANKGIMPLKGWQRVRGG